MQLRSSRRRELGGCGDQRLHLCGEKGSESNHLKLTLTLQQTTSAVKQHLQKLECTGYQKNSFLLSTFRDDLKKEGKEKIYTVNLKVYFIIGN